jgi:hypothetical protein
MEPENSLPSSQTSAFCFVREVPGSNLGPETDYSDWVVRGRVFNTPASYSGGSRVQISARRTATLTEAFRGLPQSLQEMLG